eukprot:4463031-Pleurochrysis_carterae.AAC.1
MAALGADACAARGSAAALTLQHPPSSTYQPAPAQQHPRPAPTDGVQMHALIFSPSASCSSLFAPAARGGPGPRVHERERAHNHQPHERVGKRCAHNHQPHLPPLHTQ